MTNTKHLRWLVLAGIVICVAMLAFAVVSAVHLQAQKDRAHQQCQEIERAVDAYRTSTRSPASSDEVSPDPRTLNDLIDPPGSYFGSASFLRNGKADLIDPWGNLFQMERKERTDGRKYYLITTTAPDSTPISQFGIGPEAIPKP